MTQDQNNGDLSTLALQIVENIKSDGGQKNFVEPSRDAQYWGDVVTFASLLAPPLAQASVSKKNFHGKSPITETYALTDPSHLQSKAWWNDVLAVVQQVTPVVAGVLNGGKDFQEQTALTGIQLEHMQDKAWWNDVLGLITQATPYLLNAVNGSKDFKMGEAAVDVPAIAIAPVHANDKAWWNDALQACVQLAPLVLAVL